MQTLYILIAVVSFLIIFVMIILINREKRLQGQSLKHSALATAGMFLVALAVVVSENRWLGYSLIGLGVLLSVIDLFRNLKKSNPNS